MSDVDDKHEHRADHSPSAEFRASLEREIARAYRAESQFGSMRGHRARRLGVVIGVTMAAVVTLTIGLVLGASTGYASAEVLTEHQRQATATALETARRFDVFRLRLAETNYQRIQSDFTKGVATPEALHAAKTELDTMRASVSRAEFDLRDTHSDVPLPRPTFAILRGLTARNVTQNCVSVAPVSRTQTQTSRDPAIPVLTLPTATAASVETFGGIVGVRQLANGDVLVDDGGRKQMKVLGPTLASARIVMDSIRKSANWYGTVGATPPLIRYLGDSTLFPDMGTGTLDVFDPNGARIHTLSMPTPRDAARLTLHGRADQLGRIIFSVPTPIIEPAANGKPPVVSDSEPIVRADLRLRTTDTIAYVARPMMRADAVLPKEARGGSITSSWNPSLLGTPDEWDVLTDGSIALVRGHDYHIDWIRPDGTRESTPMMPFDWRRLTDADKGKMIDSVQALRLTAARSNTLVRFGEQMTRWGDPSNVALADTVGALYSLTNGDSRVMVLPNARPTRDHVFDYYPPLRTGSVMADMDDHLWILPTTSQESKAGALVYDVVNTKGELFERVRVPAGRFVVGFGKGGVVYLASGNLTTGFYLERTMLPASNNGTSK